MKTKLLLIEEDPDILDVFTYVLEEDGFEITTSRHAEVLNEILTLKPDLILLNDWLRSEVKGSDHCRLLKANPETSAIPVILVSTFLSIKDVVMKVGANGYIIKPFNIGELKPTIEATLSGSCMSSVAKLIH